MKKQNLNELINNKDLKSITKLAKELKDFKHNVVDKGNELLSYDTFLIKEYYKVSSQFAKQVFEDQSTCDISNGAEKTIPYQVGLIRAYCSMILKG